ncbi:MAG TPA: hypothetical protein EYP10_01500, partial [Armatimonadetes bacterium]|nr:hypothetical protein [Armatimonadota bacterium]
MLRSAIIASVHRNSSTGRMRTIALLIVAFIILVGIVIHGLRRLIPTPKEIAMVLSAQLEQSMGTKVHIGRVTGNVMTGITLEDVALGDEPLSPTGAFFVTKAMKLKLRTSAVLLRRRPYTDIVKEVHIYQPVIFVARDAQGRLNITRIFKPRRPPRPPRWRLRVYLHNARIIYRDEMLTISDGKPLYLDLIPITGDVRVRGINGTSFTISGRVRDQLLRQVRIDGWQKPDGTYELNAQVHIRNLTSAQLPASVMRTVERYVNLRSGAMSANVKLKLRRYAPKRPVELSLRGTFQLAHAKVIPQQALRGAIHTPKITGSLKLTMTGKQMTKLELQAHTPTPIRRLGKLALQLNLTPPHLYTRLRLSDSHLTEWKRLLPMLQRLPQGLDIRSGIADAVNVTLERRG